MCSLGNAASIFGPSTVPGQIINTVVSDTTTAKSWTYIKGTNINDPILDSYGNRYTPATFNISVTDAAANTYDFNYAYSNSPTSYFTWWESSKSWGPYQATMNFPPNGLWICLLPSYGSLTVTAQVESR